MIDLPKGFILGGATAAYQCEGATRIDGKGKTLWDDYLKEKGMYDPDPASDFYHKYAEDIKLAHDFGLNAIRISISWTRIFPKGYGKIEQRGVDYYHQLIDTCLKFGVEPFVTLHHFDSPYELYKTGDWLNRKNIDYFVEYAKFCFKEFSSKVKKWITINEPISLTNGQYVTGVFPPCEKYNIEKAIQCEHNLILAHAKVVNEFKTMNIPGEIGIVHVLEPVYPIVNSAKDQHAADLQNAFNLYFLLDGTFKGHYGKDTMTLIQEILDKNNASLYFQDGDQEQISRAAEQIDFLGMNYYQSRFTKAYDGESKIFHNGTGSKGTSVFRLKGIGENVSNKDIPTTDWDWNIYPQGLYDMLIKIKERYPNYNKIYITENGMGYKDQFIDEHTPIDDQPRIDYIKQHLEKIKQAIDDGVNVNGYFVWSLQDMFSWANGYNKRYGLFYVDFESQKRYPKKSAYWFHKLSKTIYE